MVLIIKDTPHKNGPEMTEENMNTHKQTQPFLCLLLTTR